MEARRQGERLSHGPRARFWLQHDARLLPGGRLSVFDDQAGPPRKAPSSRGLVLRLDQRRHRATVVRTLHRPGTTSAQSEGSVQSLPGGGHFVGFGAEPWFSQFAADGRLVFDARLPVDDGTYRAYRFPWSAKPRTRPVAVLRDGFVYASWNGATDVVSWAVRGVRAARSGFETRIPVSGAGPFEVRALDAHGRVLGTAMA